jgi:hypothetical protein
MNPRKATRALYERTPAMTMKQIEGLNRKRMRVRTANGGKVATSDRSPHAAPLQRRILTADWDRLNEAERDQAVEQARQEGRCAVRWYLAEPATGDRPRSGLRGSRWAQAHREIERLDDRTLYLYAGAQTVACEGEYIAWVVEPCCARRVTRWERMASRQRRDDPRVCSFCDGYERERRRLLGLPDPPTGIADLQLWIWEAKEEERESARAWFGSTETVDAADPEEAETKRIVAQWEYRRCLLGTDLAHMLLDAAIYRCQREVSR